MNLEWFAIHKLQQSHILHQYGVNTYLGQLVNQLLHLIQLVVVNYRVKRYVYLNTKLMSIFAKLADIVDAIAHGRTGSEFRCSDIYGISTMIDGGDTTSQILGRS